MLLSPLRRRTEATRPRLFRGVALFDGPYALALVLKSEPGMPAVLTIVLARRLLSGRGLPIVYGVADVPNAVLVNVLLVGVGGVRAIILRVGHTIGVGIGGWWGCYYRSLFAILEGEVRSRCWAGKHVVFYGSFDGWPNLYRDDSRTTGRPYDAQVTDNAIASSEPVIFRSAALPRPKERSVFPVPLVPCPAAAVDVEDYQEGD